MSVSGTHNQSRTLRWGLPLLVVGGAAVGLSGLLLGATVFGPGPASRLTGNGIAEIHVLGDNVYLGRIVDEANGYLLVGAPAVLVADPNSDEAAPQLLVQLLAVDPYDTDGDVLIPIDQIVLIGKVAAGSGLEHAYLDATGENSAATPSPAS